MDTPIVEVEVNFVGSILQINIKRQNGDAVQVTMTDVKCLHEKPAVDVSKNLFKGSERTFMNLSGSDVPLENENGKS